MARTRPGRAIRLGLAAAGLLGALPGCIIGEPENSPELPGEMMPAGRQVRTAFQVDRPGDEPLAVFLALDEDTSTGGLLAGMITIRGMKEPLSGEVTALLDASEELRLANGSVHADDPDLTYFGWSKLRIALRDADGDGIYDSGTGRVEGSYWDDFEASPTAAPVTATLRAEGAPGDVLLPWQSFVLDFQQPVLHNDTSDIRVLANGQVLPGYLAVVDPVGLHVSMMRFLPDGFHRFDGELRVELGDLKNSLGTPVEIADAPLRVMPDPGPVSTNLGFEQDLAGWHVVGSATALPGFYELTPAEGTHLAVIETGAADGTDGALGSYDSRLIGYLDVPADASELDLALTVLTPGDLLPSEVAVRLYRDDFFGEPDVFPIYEFRHYAETFVTCACESSGGLAQYAGPVRAKLGLDAFRGERVFLELSVDGNGLVYSQPAALRFQPATSPPPPPAPPTRAALIVDDLQIR